MKKILQTFIFLGLVFTSVNLHVVHADGCTGLSTSDFPSCSGSYQGGGFNGNGSVASYSCSNPNSCYTDTKGCNVCLCSSSTIQGKSISGLTTNANGQCAPVYNGSLCQVSQPGGSTVQCPYGVGSGGSGGSGGADYTASVVPQTASTYQGGSAMYTITVTPNSGEAGGIVTFTINNWDCPQGSTCTFSGGNFNSNSVVFEQSNPQPKQLYLTIQTTGSTYAPNTYQVPFTANSNVNKNIIVYLAVSQPTDNAICSSVSLPSTVAPGQSFSGTFVMYNNGTKNWIFNGPVNGSSYLATKNPDWNQFWGINNIPLPRQPITPGSSGTFTGTFTAPSTPGTYNLAMQMVEIGYAFYGAQCSQNINVSSCTPATTGVMTAPSSVQTGSSFYISCDYGSANDYIYAPSGCTWPGNNGGHVGSAATFTCVAPGTAQNVTYTCSPSNVPGFTNFCTLPASVSKTVAVTDPAPLVTITSNYITGPAPLSVTLTWSANAGTCTASGGWSGTKALSGSQQITGISGTVSYTLTCVNGSGSNSQTVTVTGIPLITGTLNVTAAHGGTITSNDGFIRCGTVSCTHTYSQSPAATVTLTATPDSSLWKFAGWIGACSGTGTCTLTMDAVKAVSALFVARPLIYQEF